jgi:hypothetical protein
VTTEQYAKVFAEWDRRWRENPEWFTSEAVHLLKETPDEYGPLTAAYFELLIAQLFPELLIIAISKNPPDE